ncbi:VOC family protein [Cumulibacter manganitolerans]|uniref:VOC family protein n=1 Tax=Cumulibacter manganitolerans TaxID=1884992 RepID=UPI0018861465|nr:VOC family protein [Cumulibacter manganitolerans]
MSIPSYGRAAPPSAPAIRATSVTVMSPAPRRLAAFYAALLSAPVTAEEPARPGEPEDAGWAQVSARDLTVNFEWERHWRTPRWPAQAGAQTSTQHLDLRVDDLEAAARWAVECGAVRAAHQPQDDVVVLLDPSGHPFCLFR